MCWNASDASAPSNSLPVGTIPVRRPGAALACAAASVSTATKSAASALARERRIGGHGTHPPRGSAHLRATSTEALRASAVLCSPPWKDDKPPFHPHG